MADELTDDALAGSFRVFQRRRGHRYSLDDVATAWEACHAAEDREVRHVLDLGCGIGSVLLMTAYKLPSARLTGIEAQEISIGLARRNVARNGVGDRVQLVHGDLREEPLLETLADVRFDLVTGTPPYMPPSTGTPSTDSQRAHARMELRGGVEDYLAAAARLVAEDGLVVVCADARTPERALNGGQKAGLAPRRRRDVIPRLGHKGPLFTVWTFSPATAPAGALVEEPPLAARDAGGGRTDAAHGLRRYFDLPVDESEPPSP